MVKSLLVMTSLPLLYNTVYIHCIQGRRLGGLQKLLPHTLCFNITIAIVCRLMLETRTWEI